MAQDGGTQKISWLDTFHEVTKRGLGGGGHDSGQGLAEVRLADNTPVWHAFLLNPNAMVIDKGTEQNARAGARACLTRCELKQPKVGELIQGKSLQEARRILEEIENRPDSTN